MDTRGPSQDQRAGRRGEAADKRLASGVVRRVHTGTPSLKVLRGEDLTAVLGHSPDAQPQCRWEVLPQPDLRPPPPGPGWRPPFILVRNTCSNTCHPRRGCQHPLNSDHRCRAGDHGSQTRVSPCNGAQRSSTRFPNEDTEVQKDHVTLPKVRVRVRGPADPQTYRLSTRLAAAL